MKFIYNNYKPMTKGQTSQTSMFEHFLNTEHLNKTDTLENVADKIKNFLKMEKGSIEILVGFKYNKVIKKNE